MDSHKGNNDFINIGGIKINIIQIPAVIDLINGWIHEKTTGNYIVVSNLNDLIASKNDLEVQESVNNSSLSVPDGFSLIILARLYGYYLKRRVYGPELMLEFLKTSEDKGYSHFFYGSTEPVLNKLIFNLKKSFPKLKVAGFYTPPFRELNEQEDGKIVDKINQTQPDVLWVGLGCPKQQLWMYRHRGRIKVPVMVGVGAAFDFLSGIKPQAPCWVRNNGFEWLFRLIIEPKRLWRRYLIGNSIFLWIFLKIFFKIKILKKDNSYD